MTTLKALLFDVDGTLAETERDGHRVAFNASFAAHGLDWNWSESLYGELLAITGGRERIAHFAAQVHPGWLARADAAERIAEMHRDKNRRFAELLAQGQIALRPGLQTLLDEARAVGLRLGIVTTTSRDNLRALRVAAFKPELRDAFELHVTGEDVTLKKPDPECYRRALSALELPPQQVLAIEDSGNGLRAATAAGLRTLIARSVYFRHECFDGALAVIDEFTDMPLTRLRSLAEQS